MRVLVALALVSAAACGRKSESPVPAVPALPTSGASLVRVRGLLLARDSSLFVVACGTTTERPVAARPASQLTDAMVSVVGALRDSMYVELMADTSGGPAVAHETLFATALAEGSRCDRPRYPYDVEAMGTEPYWHVTIDGTQLVLERPEGPLEQAFAADAAVTRGALTTITGRRDEGQVRTVKLGLLRATCRDGMSDSWYPYRAEVRFGAETLHGCARR